MKVPAYVEAGLRSLRWLTGLQTTPAGLFRPVGSDSFGDKRCAPKAFDQQPLEATATISACLAAWRADGDPQWRAEAARAFAWFLGHNDLSSRWSIWTRAPVATACIATGRMRTAAANPWYPTCSASPRFAS
jgi:hypothetical protein